MATNREVIQRGYKKIDMFTDGGTLSPASISQGLETLQDMLIHLKNIRFIDIGYNFSSTIDQETGFGDEWNQGISALLAEKFAEKAGIDSKQSLAKEINLANNDLEQTYLLIVPRRHSYRAPLGRGNRVFRGRKRRSNYYKDSKEDMPTVS